MMIIDARQAHEEETTLTLGAAKGYDAKEFIEDFQEMNVLPHVAQNKFGRKSVTRFSGFQHGIRVLAATAKEHRARLSLGQDGGLHEAGADARTGESRPDVCADDDGLQPHAIAHDWTGAPARHPLIEKGGARCLVLSIENFSSLLAGNTAQEIAYRLEAAVIVEAHAKPDALLLQKGDQPSARIAPAHHWLAGGADSQRASDTHPSQGRRTGHTDTA
jgi:hypothetical protein